MTGTEEPGFDDLETPAGPYARYLRRFAAGVVDGWTLTVVLGLLGAVSGAWPGMLAAWLYFTLLEASPLEATVGKLVLGLRVTDANGARLSWARACLRYLAKPVCLARVVVFCFLAYVLGQREVGLRVILEQPLIHDRWAGALVTRRVGERAQPAWQRAVLLLAVFAALGAAVSRHAPAAAAPEPAASAPVEAAPVAPAETAAEADAKARDVELSRLIEACRDLLLGSCRGSIGGGSHEEKYERMVGCLRTHEAEAAPACLEKLPPP